MLLVCLNLQRSTNLETTLFDMPCDLGFYDHALAPLLLGVAAAGPSPLDVVGPLCCAVLFNQVRDHLSGAIKFLKSISEYGLAAVLLEKSVSLAQLVVLLAQRGGPRSLACSQIKHHTHDMHTGKLSRRVVPGYACHLFATRPVQS